MQQTPFAVCRTLLGSCVSSRTQHPPTSAWTFRILGAPSVHQALCCVQNSLVLSFFHAGFSATHLELRAKSSRSRSQSYSFSKETWDTGNCNDYRPIHFTRKLFFTNFLNNTLTNIHGVTRNTASFADVVLANWKTFKTFPRARCCHLYPPPHPRLVPPMFHLPLHPCGPFPVAPTSPPT